VGRVGEGKTGVGGPDEAHKEHAVSDRRRVRGTIRAALMDNGATHLESYTYSCTEGSRRILVSKSARLRGVVGVGVGVPGALWWPLAGVRGGCGAVRSCAPVRLTRPLVLQRHLPIGDCGSQANGLGTGVQLLYFRGFAAKRP